MKFEIKVAGRSPVGDGKDRDEWHQIREMAHPASHGKVAYFIDGAAVSREDFQAIRLHDLVEELRTDRREHEARAVYDFVRRYTGDPFKDIVGQTVRIDAQGALADLLKRTGDPRGDCDPDHCPRTRDSKHVAGPDKEYRCMHCNAPMFAPAPPPGAGCLRCGATIGITQRQDIMGMSYYCIDREACMLRGRKTT